MTLKLCVFGNSHAAALREAWMRNPGRWPGLELSFLAAQKDHLLQTAVRDGQLIATNPDSEAAFVRISGLSRVTLADYDSFVVAGASVCLNSILPIYREARWVGLPSVAADAGLTIPAKPLVSRAAARAVMRACLQKRLGYVFAARLRQHSAQPILVTSQPRISAEILLAPRPLTRLHSIAIRQGDANVLGQEFDDLARDVLAELDCQFLPQPAQTVTHGMLTALDYVKGAHRLTAAMTVPQPESDILHANGLYGALVIDQIAAAF